ncbi:MAG: hypothetical protein ACMUHX_11415 [bacterium]
MYLHRIRQTISILLFAVWTACSIFCFHACLHEDTVDQKNESTAMDLKIYGPSIKEGDDWSLPEGCYPNPYSGMFIVWKGVRSDNPDIRHVGKSFYWADLNPAPGIFDFSQVEALLNDADQNDYGVILMIKGSVTWRESPWDDPVPFVPEWVLDECSPPRFMTAENIEVAAPWDPCLQNHYLAFIDAIGKTDILSHPALLGVYIHGISTSYGEEMWLDEKAKAAAEEAGMSSERFINTFNSRLFAWAAAAKTNVHKLVWVRAQPGIPGENYQLGGRYLDALAISLGMGCRGGGLENYHGYTWPDTGQSFDTEGHLLMDYSWPIIAEERYFGDEIEALDWWNVVPEESLSLIWTATIFRAVQMGVRFLWITNGTDQYAPEVTHWYTLVAGWPPEESPEAVCWLREDYILRNDEVVTWKNFEHLLFQRDVDQGESFPKIPVRRPICPALEPPDIDYDLTARSTCVTAGQDRLAFFMDGAFADSLSGPIQIKITYLDDTDSNWVLETTDHDGILLRSDTVSGQADGQWRTTTFTLSRPPKQGQLDQGADFCLMVETGGDLTVRFVRVIRSN